jgi:hypothetical protein
MRAVCFLLISLIFLTAGCTENPGGNTQSTPEPDVEIQNRINSENESKIPEVPAPTPDSEEIQNGEDFPPKFFARRDIVIRDSKAVLQSTSDNLFVIYHEGGDSIPFINMKIIVSENGEIIDVLTFNSDASFFKGRYSKLRSSVVRDDNFEEGDEIIVMEKPGFNLNSGEIVNVEIIDSKWNLTVMDCFVQVVLGQNSQTHSSTTYFVTIT